MEILVAAVVAALVAAAAAVMTVALLNRRPHLVGGGGAGPGTISPGSSNLGAEPADSGGTSSEPRDEESATATPAEHAGPERALVREASATTPALPAAASAPAPTGAHAALPATPAPETDAALELRERRAEITRTEERLLGKEETIALRLAEIDRRELSVEDRARNLDTTAQTLKETKHRQLRELERVAGLSTSQARQILLAELEDRLRHESAKLIRQIEEAARREATRRSRSILATSMQRLASSHAAETTVSVVTLSSDDLKGRIIGREGRNIRALETVTGVDFIVDDTPSTVVLSAFDGVRRELARLTLEKLLEDGRIHPARIEEAYEQAKGELDDHILEVGEQAVLDAGVGAVHPELAKLLGRLRYRTSSGQNVLAHSVECAQLAAMVADELGAGAKTARRAALLHDIGKAVTHEVQGPHALVGGEFTRRFSEAEAVSHAVSAHHNEVEPQTVEAVIVQVVDALSGARPGARGESLEHYVRRLRELEKVATRHAGVEKVYAMHAGREVRVIVRPEDVDDDTATLLSHRIARDVEREVEYPGQVKVTVIRESRATDYAK
jgi:ribonuclease Y